jgi:uncharacterized protein
MKYILIKLIKLYQKVPGSWHNSCRFTPTCSNYAIDALDTFGFFKGSYMAILRILRCNPYSKGGYDPVIGGKYEKKD